MQSVPSALSAAPLQALQRSLLHGAEDEESNDM